MKSEKQSAREGLYEFLNDLSGTKYYLKFTGFFYFHEGLFRLDKINDFPEQIKYSTSEVYETFHELCEYVRSLEK